MKSVLFGSGLFTIALAFFACNEQSTSSPAESLSSSSGISLSSVSANTSSSAIAISSSGAISDNLPGCYIETASGFGVDQYCVTLADGSITSKKCSAFAIAQHAMAIMDRFIETGCKNDSTLSRKSSKYCQNDTGIVYIYKSSSAIDCAPSFQHLRDMAKAGN